MKTIIAPTDFSPTSVNAVNYAADLACVINANLSLIHMYSFPVAFREVPVPASRIEEISAEAERQMEKLKETIKARTRERIQIQTEIKPGDVLSGIEEKCASVDTYAVIIGAESAGTLERVLVGGKTISAVKKLLWPLIVVPPESKLTSIRKIGLACDLKNIVDSIPFKEIRRLVVEYNAEFHVLHVSTGRHRAVSKEMAKETRWLREKLGDLNPRFHLLEGNDIDTGINKFAEQNNLDLLIIVPKKHSFISKIFQHSHSKGLVLHTHVPVMSFHE